MVNLLSETIMELRLHGKSEEDVRWVGSNDGKYAITWDEFAKIADVEYDNDYGAYEVALDLVVVGDDWWLERCEYDGKEWWEFKSLPKIAEGKKFSNVFDELKVLNNLEGDE